MRHLQTFVARRSSNTVATATRKIRPVWTTRACAVAASIANRGSVNVT